ncbi:MAG: potassium transporter TrkG [Schwartzia succinivorans]|nr:potassium transporter TrkG [Schwartzia succinivorans]
MSIRLISYLLGQTTILAGISMLIPLVYTVVKKTAEMPAFFASAIIVMCAGELFLHIGKEHPDRMKVMEGAAFMFGGSAVIAVCGMLPYLLSGNLSPVDSFFESVSNLTTTGITFFSQDSPYSLRFWGGIISWLGGLCFVMILVTILPQVVGGFGLTISREQNLMFSPVLGRMRRMAGQAAMVYLAMTAFTTLLYYLADLGPIDSLLAAMLTLSTNGGSQQMGFIVRNSVALEMAAIIAMLIASTNFLMLWQAVHHRSFKEFFSDVELRVFLLMVAVFTLIVAWHLNWTGTYDSISESLRYSLFAVVSFASTSGFIAAPVEDWPDFDRFVLLLLVFVGGCIGSSTGGLKVKRFLILFKMALSEAERTLHPHMVADIRVGGQHVSRLGVLRVLSYFFLFLATFYVFILFLTIADITMPEAAGMAVGMLSSVGTASGLYGHETLIDLPGWTKLGCCFFMLLGRLQIFGVLLLVSGTSRRQENRW